MNFNVGDKITHVNGTTVPVVFVGRTYVVTFPGLDGRTADLVRQEQLKDYELEKVK